MLFGRFKASLRDVSITGGSSFPKEDGVPFWHKDFVGSEDLAVSFISEGRLWSGVLCLLPLKSFISWRPEEAVNGRFRKLSAFRRGPKRVELTEVIKLRMLFDRFNASLRDGPVKRGCSFPKEVGLGFIRFGGSENVSPV